MEGGSGGQMGLGHGLSGVQIGVLRISSSLFYAFKYFSESAKKIIAFSGVLLPSFEGGAVGFT